MSVTAQINIRYQLLRFGQRTAQIYWSQLFRHDLGPEISAQARDVISKYSAREVYTSREKINEIRDGIQDLVEKLNKLCSRQP